jgi:8-oxo-dGTP diphosphatase
MIATGSYNIKGAADHEGDKNMADKERFKLIPEVHLVLIQDDKILLLRRFQTGYEDGNYGMIAGRADGKETMREAITREALEESGIIVDSQELEQLLTMHRWCEDCEGNERIAFFFRANSWQGEIRNMEPHKCDDLQWFPLDRLPDNTIPYIRHAIECCIEGTHYCEFGWKNE